MTEITDSLLQRIADRLEHIEAEIKLVGAKTDRIDGIETGLSAMQAKTDRIEAQIASLGAKTERIELDVSTVRVRTAAQPDMRLLFQNVKLTLEHLVMVERDLVMLRSAINDYGRENVTPGEIQAIHQALDTLREADLDREARLRVLEAHLSA